MPRITRRIVALCAVAVFAVLVIIAAVSEDDAPAPTDDAASRVEAEAESSADDASAPTDDAGSRAEAEAEGSAAAQDSGADANNAREDETPTDPAGASNAQRRTGG